MAKVEISRLRKAFGGLEVIHGVDLDIGDGEFVALVGPSGCGKSTLLRMIAGLERVSGGDIHIGGRRVNDVPPKDRDIAMVFQSYALYPHMTVAQNMGFSLRLRRVSREEFDREVRRAAAILGLEYLLDRYPRQLSGGQRQRVAMGRAIVRDPAVFLFDEPLSNLDAKLRVQTRAEIKALHQRLRTTTIYVTHDQIEAMTMADRIVVMNGGKVEQVGTPLELYDRPANHFVAGFLGSPSMNFFDGRVDGSAGTSFMIGDHAMSLGDAAMNEPGPVVLGVRPEHIVLDPEGLPAEIVVVEPTGSETQVTARLGGQTFSAALRERFSVPVGSTFRFRVDPANLHLFDKKTGVRLADHQAGRPR
jgi:multiple sugar transport system ATP-binding protein